ncbi:MAG: EamA family transporter [Ruegeria sp.]
MKRTPTFFLTALAPVVWGSTYLITSESLPEGYPLSAAVLRALPAGLLLLMFSQTLPRGIWIVRTLILGALNFSIFWWLLFVAAYQLPGGVAALVGALQPLVVLLLATSILNEQVQPKAVFAGSAGVVGVGCLVLSSEAQLDALGLVAALGGAISMACGTVLSKKWQPAVSTLSFTAWQLVAGGIILSPFAMYFEPPLPHLSPVNVAGFSFLSLIGGALTYVLWFRGISQLGPATVAPLGLLSPVAAVLLGWSVLSQTLNPIQIGGMFLILASVWLSQHYSQSHRSCEVK